MVGTPNAGSAIAVRDLIDGHKLAPFLPDYPAAVLGTMPSVYQLLPRSRHGVLMMADSQQALPILDSKLWVAMQWGLADPRQDKILKRLLPDVPEAESRRRIALEHQAKCLARAEQLQRALDIPAKPPNGVTLHLFAGDSIATPAVLTAASDGEVQTAGHGPGDDTTLRTSAVLDERSAQGQARPRHTPIQWTSTMFLRTSHRGLTSDPIFMDNVLSLLLETPR